MSTSYDMANQVTSADHYLGGGYPFLTSTPYSGAAFQSQLDDYIGSVRDISRGIRDASSATQVWSLVQTQRGHDDQNLPATYRLPTMEEMLCSVNLALAQGAKGIVYYLYVTVRFSQNYTETGLLDANRNPNPNGQYNNVRDINTNYQGSGQTLVDIGANFLNLTWQEAISVHNNLNEPIDATDDLYDVTSRPPGGGDDPEAQTYVEVGILQDAGNDNHYMVVNRRATASRDVTVTFQSNANNAYRITDVFSSGTTTYYPAGGTTFSYTLSLGPGEGRLLRLEDIGAWSGTIASNTTWSGTVYVNGNTTVNNGVTLTVSNAATIQFASGTGLTVNGTLNANGTFSQPILFDRSGSSNWYGIVINSGSGSSSQVKFSTIKNASYGLYINGASPTVSNTKINYCGTGVQITSGGAAKFFGNTITYNDYNGVYCIAGASPSFGVFPTYGNNVIRRNGDRGINAEYSCTVFLGQNMLPPSGGRNSIYENYNTNGYQISIRYGSTSMAENNWWGSDPPSSSIFQDPWTIDYDPWWPGSDPHSGRPLTKAASHFVTNTLPSTGDNGLAMADSMKEQLWRAFIFYQKAEYDSASQISKQIIAAAPSSLEAISALNVLRLAHLESEKPGFKSYLTDLIAQHAGKELAGTARLNWAWYFLGKNNPAGALAQLQENVTEFPNSPLERISLFQQVTLFLFDLLDRNTAEAAFAELQQKYPGDPLVTEAQRLLGNAAQQNSQKPLTQSGAAETDTARIILQNVPNPFNPSTKIQYTLPHEGEVTIRIFNLLGEEVRAWENLAKPAGNHFVFWDGKGAHGVEAGSGVYLYQVIYQSRENGAKPVLLNRKMTLVR